MVIAYLLLVDLLQSKINGRIEKREKFNFSEIPHLELG